MLVKIERVRKLRVLDFDIEARPLNYYGGDFVGKEPTAIACRFTDEPKSTVMCWALGDFRVGAKEMLEGFLEWYNEADIVTGHFIRGYDLPVLNGALIEHGMAPLSDKMTHDTKLDLIKFTGLSKSQKNIAGMLHIADKKLDMDAAMWRSANRLEPKGIALAKQRVMNDVHQNITMRAKLLEAGLLRPPRWWTSQGPTRVQYTP